MLGEMISLRQCPENSAVGVVFLDPGLLFPDHGKSPTGPLSTNQPIKPSQDMR